MTDLDALQRTLAAEHAAVYIFGVLSGRAAPLGPSPLRQALSASYEVHVTRRDDLRVRVTAAGGDPVAAEPAYALPRPLTTPAQLAGRALLTERACVSTYAALVAAATGADRAWAVAALAAGALAETSFGGAARPLPGVSARA